MDQLLKLDDSALTKYLHAVIDGYIGRSGTIDVINSDASLKDLPSSAHSKLALKLISIFEKAYSLMQKQKETSKNENYKNSNKNKKLSETKKNEMETINIQSILLKDYFDNKNENDFIIDTILSVLEIRENEFNREAKKRAILAGLPDCLQDFDWSLRLVMSSSQLTTVRIPVVLLSLKIQKDDNKIENVNLQLNKQDLDKFIAHLTNCQKIVKEVDRQMNQSLSVVP